MVCLSYVFLYSGTTSDTNTTPQHKVPAPERQVHVHTVVCDFCTGIRLYSIKLLISFSGCGSYVGVVPIRYRSLSLCPRSLTIDHHLFHLTGTIPHTNSLALNHFLKHHRQKKPGQWDPRMSTMTLRAPPPPHPPCSPLVGGQLQLPSPVSICGRQLYA